MQPSLKTTIRRTLGLLVVVVAFLHAAAVGIYLMPDSPLRRLFAWSNNEYISRFWSQNWHLFSPNPPTSTSIMHVRCSQGTMSTSWLDVTSGMAEVSFTNPLTSYPKLRLVYNSVHDEFIKIVSASIDTMCGKATIENANDEKQKACRERHSVMALKDATKSPQYANAARFSYDSCKTYLSAGKPTKVEMRVVNQYVFPFSERASIGTRRFFKTEYADIPSVVWDPEQGGMQL